jgi:arylsulfatase
MQQPLALYDIEVDPAESVDVQHANPEVVERLLAIAESARADLGDSLTKRAGAGRREPGRVPKNAG